MIDFVDRRTGARASACGNPISTPVTRLTPDDLGPLPVSANRALRGAGFDDGSG
jgi:hypothetical protein